MTPTLPYPATEPHPTLAVTALGPGCQWDYDAGGFVDRDLYAATYDGVTAIEPCPLAAVAALTGILAAAERMRAAGNNAGVERT